MSLTDEDKQWIDDRLRLLTDELTEAMRNIETLYELLCKAGIIRARRPWHGVVVNRILTGKR